jgi:hypothetical protein
MFRSAPALVLPAVAAVLLAGCQAEYAAEVVNRSPQPVYANLFRKGPSQPVLGDSRRVSPGDRTSVGPVGSPSEYGAYLAIEPVSTRSRPATVDLPRGLSSFEIQQDGDAPDAPLRIVEKRGPTRARSDSPPAHPPAAR